MTYPEILALARKCGFDGPFIPAMYSCNKAALQSFTAAIAEHCARVADAAEEVFRDSRSDLAADIASEIRSAFPAPETKR